MSSKYEGESVMNISAMAMKDYPQKSAMETKKLYVKMDPWRTSINLAERSEEE